MLIYSVLHRVNTLFQTRVPVVFDRVVCSAHELLRDEAPLLGGLVSEDEKHPLLFLRPFCSFDFRVQMIEPAFSARFSTSSSKCLWEISPHHVFVAFSLIVDVPEDGFVLIGSPVSNWIGGWFLQWWFHKFTLDLECSILYVWCLTQTFNIYVVNRNWINSHGLKCKKLTKKIGQKLKFKSFAN